MDARVVEISKSSLDYKLLIVPGVAVMDEAMATDDLPLMQKRRTFLDDDPAHPRY
jgi:hypothetical protein